MYIHIDIFEYIVPKCRYVDNMLYITCYIYDIYNIEITRAYIYISTIKVTIKIQNKLIG